mgnify:CR=1 FL=1|jgi:hypothetical protein
MNNSLKDIKIGNALEYNFLYSNEEKKYGLVVDIKKDNNFHAMIYLLTENEIDIVPYSIILFKVLK